ncbi:MAG: SPASM domain-containing protein, partial [Chloroflexi bacterium]|nr:SPASM domain-containing protein [Chloroflexota bacterium]
EHNHHCLVAFMEAIGGWGFEGVTFSHMNFVTEEMAAAHNAQYGHVVEATASSIAWADPWKVDLDVLGEQVDQLRGRWRSLVSFTPELERPELETYYRDHLAVVRSKRCAVPWQSAQILADGDVVPISRCFNIPLGNIYDSSFADIWRGEKMALFRRELRDAGLFPACTRCCGVLG